MIIAGLLKVKMNLSMALSKMKILINRYNGLPFAILFYYILIFFCKFLYNYLYGKE